MKIFVIIEDEGMYYDHKPVGVCSSKKKAELAILAYSRYDCSPLSIMEFDLDGFLEEMTKRLNGEKEDYKQVLDLLKQIDES